MEKRTAPDTRERDTRESRERRQGHRRPEGEGTRRRYPEDERRERARRRHVEGTVSSDEELERLIEEKYREIEYLEAQSRRQEVSGSGREDQRTRSRNRETGGHSGPARRQGEERSREDSYRNNRRNDSRNDRRGDRREEVRRERRGDRRDEARYDRREDDRRESRYESEARDSGSYDQKEEKPFFSERLIKYIGGIIGIIIVLLVVFVVFGGSIFGKLGIGSEAGLASGKGVINILLVGQDGREEVEGSRSDSMMLVSVNKDTHKVKIVSLMRDMYVSIPGYEDNRINASYSLGGIDLLEKTVEQNFQVKIDGNVQIDFESFKTIIDKVDGVDIELSQAEADYLNTAYWQNGWTLAAGVQTLNGEQALAYSRIRQVGNSDFERTERQRNVLMTVFRKVKGQGKVKMLSLAKDIYPMLDTDIGIGDMLSLGLTAISLDEGNIETYRLPVDGGYENQTIRDMQVLVPDLEKNRAYLKELLFGSGEE